MTLILNHHTALLKYFSPLLFGVRKEDYFTYRLIGAIALLLTVLFFLQ